MSEKVTYSSEATVEPPAPAALAGKYQLLARLGQGGMADVFLAVARGPLGFNKLVVLKRLRTNDEDDQALQMFLDEARLAARLKHPNIVDTYDVGQEVDSYFIAMEYLEGQPLSRVLKAVGTTRVHPTIWVHIVAEALHGLHHAHELRDYDGSALQIVHRDVSPHNIFVTYEAEVKVVDFGIAKTKLSVAHTESGLLRGKLGYMAPEQALREPVDRRSDVFAMGVVLWEALAGRKAFDGDMSTMFAKLIQADVPKINEVNPAVDSALALIVGRALKKEPSERYANAAEMREALLDYAHAVPGAASKNDVTAAMAALFGEHRALVKREIEKQLALVARTQPKEGNFWDASKMLVTDDTSGGAGAGRPQSAPPVASGSLSRAYTASPSGQEMPPLRSFNRTVFAVLATIAAIAGASSWLVVRYGHRVAAPASIMPLPPVEAPVTVAPLPPEKVVDVPKPAPAPPPRRASNPERAAWPASRAESSRAEQSQAIVRSFPADPAPSRSTSSRSSHRLRLASSTPTVAEGPALGTVEPTAAPAAQRASATPAPAASRPGTIDASRITATIRAHADEIQGCLERARMDRPDLQGRVVVQSTIGPDGRVQSASASSNIDGGSRLQGCVVAAWRSWTFPAPAGGVPATISKTFNFE
jgi:serine/threonine-protein kinase